MISAAHFIILYVVTTPKNKVLAQTTAGWCSPNIANVTGSVTVTCIGVDPRAQEKLNAELRFSKAEVAEKLRQANEWAERYHELEKRLANSEWQNELSRRAEQFLHEGELAKAGQVLDQILQNDEKNVDRIAADHYNRALAFLLQFRPVDALPHLAKAYQYRPEHWGYGEVYGTVLLEQNDFGPAESVLTAS